MVEYLLTIRGHALRCGLNPKNCPATMRVIPNAGEDKQGEAGVATAELCRRHGISEQTD